MRQPLLLALLAIALVAPTATPAPLPTPCEAGEARSVTLAGDEMTLCLVDVPLLQEGAPVTRATSAGAEAVSTEGVRTLGGVVAGDPQSFVRVVEAPGYFAGMVRTTSGWYWVHPDGEVRTQPPNPTHTPWVDPQLHGGPGAPAVGRILLQADDDHLSDWGDAWHLYAITIINNVDGALRAQLGYGLTIVGVEGGQTTPHTERQAPTRYDHVQVLSGTDAGNSPLGEATVATGGTVAGWSWVRTSPALNRSEAFLGGDYLGTLYGATWVSLHELGHNLIQVHDPLTAHVPPEKPHYVCTAYGGWHGEGTNCLDIGPWWRPVNTASGGLILARQEANGALGPDLARHDAAVHAQAGGAEAQHATHARADHGGVTVTCEGHATAPGVAAADLAALPPSHQAHPFLDEPAYVDC